MIFCSLLDPRLSTQWINCSFYQLLLLFYYKRATIALRAVVACVYRARDTDRQSNCAIFIIYITVPFIVLVLGRAVMHQHAKFCWNCCKWSWDMIFFRFSRWHSATMLTFKSVKFYLLRRSERYGSFNVWREWLENVYSRPKIGALGLFDPLNGVQYGRKPKRDILAWIRIVWAIKRENPSTDLTCTWVPQKRGINK